MRRLAHPARWPAAALLFIGCIGLAMHGQPVQAKTPSSGPSGQSVSWLDYYGRRIDMSTSRHGSKLATAQEYGIVRDWRYVETKVPLRPVDGGALGVEVDFAGQLGTCSVNYPLALRGSAMFWLCPFAKDPTSMALWQYMSPSKLAQRGPALDSYTIYNHQNSYRYIYRIRTLPEMRAEQIALKRKELGELASGWSDLRVLEKIPNERLLPREDLVGVVCPGPWAQLELSGQNAARIGDRFVARNSAGDFMGANWIGSWNSSAPGRAPKGWAIGQEPAVGGASTTASAKAPASRLCEELVGCAANAAITAAGATLPCDGAALCTAVREASPETLKSWVEAGGACQKAVQIASGIDFRALILESLSCGAALSPAGPLYQEACKKSPEVVGQKIAELAVCKVARKAKRRTQLLLRPVPVSAKVRNFFTGENTVDVECTGIGPCAECANTRKSYIYEVKTQDGTTEQRETVASCGWQFLGALGLGQDRRIDAFGQCGFDPENYTDPEFGFVYGARRSLTELQRVCDDKEDEVLANLYEEGVPADHLCNQDQGVNCASGLDCVCNSCGGLPAPEPKRVTLKQRPATPSEAEARALAREAAKATKDPNTDNAKAPRTWTFNNNFRNPPPPMTASLVRVEQRCRKIWRAGKWQTLDESRVFLKPGSGTEFSVLKRALIDRDQAFLDSAVGKTCQK